MDNFNDIDLLQVIRAFQQETFAKLNVMRIGIIEEVLVDNEVRCSITNKKLIKTNPDGTSTWRDYPPIFAKVWYMGSGLNGIDFPLTVNTPCLLLFNDREFTSYFDSGKVSTLANTLMHDLSYCVCIPLYQAVSDSNVNIKSATNLNLSATTALNLSATTINITASAVNITGTLTINGQPYLSHAHSNGNLGSPTGSVII
jgi:hypothetical protein